MPITPDPTYSRIGLSLHLYLLGFKRLSLTYKSALRLSHPIHLRCIGSYLSLFLYPFTSSFSLLILYLPSHFLYLHPRSLISVGSYFALFTLYTHFTYIPSIPPLHCKGVNSSHPISKIGGYYITLPLYITLSFCILLLLYLLFNLISLLYLLYYYIFSITRRVFHTYGVCLHLIYPIYLLLLYSYIYFSLYHIFTILSYSLYLSLLLPVGCYGVGFTSYSLSLYPLIVYLILSILYQIYPSFLYGTHSSSITRRCSTPTGFLYLLY